MIRILQFAHVINRYDFIDTIITNANKQEFEFGVCVYSLESNITRPNFSIDIPVWNINSHSNYKNVKRLISIFSEWKPDIVHAHHYNQALLAAISVLNSKTSLVIGRHYSDSLYRLPLIKKIIYLAGEQFANHVSSRIIVPSNKLYNILVDKQGVNPSKVDLIPYGFDQQKYIGLSLNDRNEMRNELNITSDKIVLGIFGRIDEQKGHWVMLNAMPEILKKIPNIVLLIVGEGGIRPAIEKWISEKGLNNSIYCLGWRKDAIRVMTAVDIVVHPSFQEAFSQVMVEAMWMRKPLIISDVGGARDVIDNGINGLIIESGNCNMLAKAVIDVCLKADRGISLGQAARRYIENNLMIDNIILKYEDSYRRVTG